MRRRNIADIDKVTHVRRCSLLRRRRLDRAPEAGDGFVEG